MTSVAGGRIQQVADAAIEVLADQGARGLTHRAVDRAAGMPTGTTSNYARTRGALLTLALARMAELDAADGAQGLSGAGVAASEAPTEGIGVAELAGGLAGTLYRMTSDEPARRRVRARFELAFEATRRPELRAVYDDMGRGFRTQAAALLSAAGAADPEASAWTLVAWMEGVLFYALAGAGNTSPPSAATLQDQLTRLLTGLCGDHRGGA